MKLTIKGSANKVFDIEIGAEATVADLKSAIEAQESIQVAQIRLIYSGKVLVDSNTLASYKIEDGHNVHMVVAKARPASSASGSSAAPPPPQELPTPPPPQPNSNPLPGYGDAGGFPGMGGGFPGMGGGFPGMGGGFPGMGGGGFPDMGGMDIGAMMNNPMVQQMMDQVADNPQLLADMVRSNPMFANNPMMQSVLNNPELLRQQINAFRAMQRNQNPQQQNPQQQNPQQQNPGVQNPGVQPNVQPGFPAMSGFPGMGGFPGMDLGAMMNNPMVQQMMQQVADNPQLLADMIRSNPMFANNPMFQSLANNPEQLRQQMQMATQMMNSQQPAPPSSAPPQANPQANPFSALFGQPPSAAPAPGAAPSANQVDPVLLQHLLEAPVLPMHQQLLSNQEVQRGLNLVQQGIQLCRRSGLMLFNNIPNIDAIVSRYPAPPPATPGVAPAGTTGSAPEPQPVFQLTPEQRFGNQLNQLNDMGFQDNQRNIEALTATHGNVQLAIDWLMSH